MLTIALHKPLNIFLKQAKIFVVLDGCWHSDSVDSVEELLRSFTIPIFYDHLLFTATSPAWPIYSLNEPAGSGYATGKRDT